MGKRKNGEYSDYWQIKLVVLSVAFMVISVVLFGAGRTDRASPVPTKDICFDGGAVDYVMVGFEGDRDMRRDSPALLDALGSMKLQQVDRLPVDAKRHVDIGLYDEWDLQGTMLFWQIGMREWYVVVNDGDRRLCGVYAVDDVAMVMDGLR